MSTHGAGRTLADSAFTGDDGAPDPTLAAALRRAAADRSAVVDVVTALASCRVLVPVVAVAGQTGVTGTGLTVDKTSDLAVVTLTAPDGRQTLPVFSGLAQLAAWDPAARPVPVAARTAALSAVDEGCQLLVLDPAGAAVVVPRPALWALAQGRTWTPSPEHPAVHSALRDAVASEAAVVRIAGQRGLRAELQVVMWVRAGLDRAALDALTSRVSRALASSTAVAELVDSVELRVEPA